MASSVSIGRLRYDIVADTSGLTASLAKARNELSTAKKVFAETATPAERFGVALQSLNKAFTSNAITAAQYRRSLVVLKTEMAAASEKAAAAAYKESEAYKRLNREIAEYARNQGAANRAQQMRLQHVAGMATGGGIRGAASMAGLSAAGAGFAGMSFSRDVIRDFMDLEAAIADFGVLAGDKGIGKALIDDFRTLAKETPLVLSSINNAARTLLSFGVDSNKLGDALRRLGDVSGGNAERFERLALVYGQVTAAQRLQGQDLLQFVNAGWNPLLEITKQSGESMMDIRKRMEEGAVSINEVEQALIAATSAGGRFEGRMVEMAKTVRGQMDILKGDFSQFRTSIGETFAPLISMGIGVGGAGLKGLQMRQGAFEGIRSRISGGILSLLGRELPREAGGKTPGQQSAQAGKPTLSPEARAAMEANEAAYRLKVEERIDAIRESQLEKGREMNRQAMQHMQEMQRFNEQRENVIDAGRKRIADVSKGVQKVQVELAPSARRGSREEYQLLASIANKNGVEEAARHARAQEIREKIATIMGEVRDRLAELKMPEAI